jgi:hypothetical protein
MGRSSGKKKKRTAKTNRHLDFGDPRAEDGSVSRNNHRPVRQRAQYEKSTAQFLQKNQEQLKQVELPRPFFPVNNPETVFVTPMKHETVPHSVEERMDLAIPDGVFFIKGKTGAELFRQMISDNSISNNVDNVKSKSNVPTPEAPRKSKRRDSF